MSDIPQELAAYPVHPLPIIKAYADQLGLVEVVNQLVPTEMDMDPGTSVLGMILDTLSGRSPLYRLEAFCAQPDTALLFGKAVPAEVFNDDTVGRVLDRLYEAGTTKLFTACAVRAEQVFGFDKRYVHFDTTSVRVYGDYLPPEELPKHERPFTITRGDSKDKRPALKQFVLSTLGVDRAVPLWGRPEDGNASDKTLNTTLVAEVASWLAQHGVQPGAYSYVADAALVSEDNLAALGNTFFVSRLPATYNECGRVIAEAGAQENWHEVGVLAHTKPTKHRPGAAYKVAERTVTLYGQASRAVVGQSSTQAQRRLKRLEREGQASYVTLRAMVQAAQQRDYFCRADAEAAAEHLRRTPSASHQVAVQVEARPTYGKGRPSPRLPRPVKEMRYGLTATLTEHATHLARKRAEADCFVFLTTVPTAGAMAHRPEEGRRVYKEPQGIEQNYGFLKAPFIVNSLCLKKAERIAALGLVLLLSLRLWRRMERQRRAYVETTETLLIGWDKKSTARPTACMMTSKFAGLLVLKIGRHRQLARPLSGVQQQYLTALGLVSSCFTGPLG